ncbi:hypothetical protein Bpfe_016513 [Biomphalaria pfeifferi]|uniref:Uncharacterized protein n=1 Tax=Biomphalaria pfeifferi TaxID=112525 RepID=A0AAD8BGV2_BIOPF|nr:hypothetical protein Bpfe_016513 [Biomphalaria pfeifferi]
MAIKGPVSLILLLTLWTSYSIKLQAWPCTDGIQTDNTRTTISKNGVNQRTYKTKLIPNRGENSLHTLKKQFRIGVNISILLGEKLQSDWGEYLSKENFQRCRGTKSLTQLKQITKRTQGVTTCDKDFQHLSILNAYFSDVVVNLTATVKDLSGKAQERLTSYQNFLKYTRRAMCYFEFVSNHTGSSECEVKASLSLRDFMVTGVADEAYRECITIQNSLNLLKNLVANVNNTGGNKKKPREKIKGNNKGKRGNKVNRKKRPAQS